MRILVVDDEPAVRDSLRRALELEGYEVDLAVDGEAALAHLAQPMHPDAVILDILMPGVGGLELARRVHRLPPPQDRGRRETAADPHSPRGRVRAAGLVMTFRARIAVAAAAAVALTIVVASVILFFVVRSQLRAPIDDSLRARAADVQSRGLTPIQSPDGKTYLGGIRPAF